MDSIELIELSLEIESVIIGERFKGGVFRPCLNILPSSTIKGALFHFFGINSPAVGFFIEDTYQFDEISYSIHDKALHSAKMPLFSSYLKPKYKSTKIQAQIYLPINEQSKKLREYKGESIQIGALKSKGFGKSKIIDIEEINSEIKQGNLKVSIFEDETEYYKINQISPIFGFLFKPDIFRINGEYIRALQPGSIVNAPSVIIKEETFYDEL